MHRLGLRVSQPRSLLFEGVRRVYLALAQDQLEAFVAGEQLAQNHALLALGLVGNLDLLGSLELYWRVGPLLGSLVLLGFLSHLVLLENASRVLIIPRLRLLLVRLRALNFVFSPRSYLHHIVLGGVILLPHLNSDHRLGVAVRDVLIIFHDPLGSGGALDGQFSLGLRPLPLLLLLPLDDDELVGADALVDEVEVQHDQVDQQEHKDGVDCPRAPSHDELAEELVRAGLEGEGEQGCDVEEQVEEGCDDHGEKGAVVVPPHAVIDPHAVVVEILHAAIAGLAVPGLVLHVALAVVAEEQLVLVATSKLFKPASPQKYSTKVLLR